MRVVAAGVADECLCVPVAPAYGDMVDTLRF